MMTLSRRKLIEGVAALLAIAAPRVAVAQIGIGNQPNYAQLQPAPSGGAVPPNVPAFGVNPYGSF